MSDRVEDANEAVSGDREIPVGSQVWLYFDRTKPGYARKLAHLWHGPFRVSDRVGEYIL